MRGIMGRVTKLGIGESRIDTFEILLEDGSILVRLCARLERLTTKVGGFRLTDVVFPRIPILNR